MTTRWITRAQARSTMHRFGNTRSALYYTAWRQGFIAGCAFAVFGALDVVLIIATWRALP